MRKQQKILLVRRSIFVLFILLAHLVQNTPGWFPSFFGIRVYFLLTFTVCLGLFEREIAGALFGLLAGVLWDTVAPLGDGYHALLFLLIGAVCGILINTVMRNNLITALLLNLGAHLLYAALYTVLFVLAEGIDGAGWLFVRYYLPAALLSVLFTPIVYLLVRFVMRRTRIR
ncbi:MAG: rod shape-determining protein MreD [Candidatus Fimenecus sp.]